MRLRLPFRRGKDGTPREVYCEIGIGKRKSKTKEPVITRVDFDKCENMYIHDPPSHRGVNLYELCIKAAGFTARSEKEPVQVEITKILKKTQFKHIVTHFAPVHLGICGNSFIELIPNSAKSKIVEFTVVDYKLMDFQKDSLDNVKFDDYGRPVGWVEEISAGKDIEFSRDEMYHLTLNQILPGEMGIGFIEPAYSDVETKENIEKGKGGWAYSQGFPIPLIRYGDDMHPPTPTMKVQAEKLARELADSKTVSAAYPSYFKLEHLEYGRTAMELEADLMYYTKLQAGLMGIPVALLLQAADKEKQGTLDTLIEFFEIAFQGFQKSLMIEEILQTVLERNLEGLFEPDDLIFEYGELSDAMKKEAVMRIMRLAKVGLIDKEDEDVQKHIKDTYIKRLSKV